MLREVLAPSRKLIAARFTGQSDGQTRHCRKRVPQDGRISLRIGGRAVDGRVSTIPSSHGERVVMRLLDKTRRVLICKVWV